MTVDLTALPFSTQHEEKAARIARGAWHPGARLCKFIMTPDSWQLAS